MLAFKWSNLFSIFDNGGTVLFGLLSGDDNDETGGGAVGGTGGWGGATNWTGICNFNCGFCGGIVIVLVIVGGDTGGELFWFGNLDWLLISWFAFELGYK